MKLAIAGCGRISQLGYVPALRALPEVELCGVADPDRERRERLAADAGAVRAFESFAAMIAGTAPDAVVIASPPGSHLDQAALAAEAGIAALVEKPPGRDADEASRLAALDGRVWIGFNRRFSHLVAIEGNVPSEGELEISLRLSYRRRSWRAHQVHDDALADLGPHLADLAACLLGGELRSARAILITPERARIELTGRRGLARIECQTDSSWSEQVQVRRRSGGPSARSVHGGLRRGVLARLRRGEHPLAASLAAQLRALASSLRGESAAPLATAADGVVAMRALDAARLSATGGGATVEL